MTTHSNSPGLDRHHWSNETLWQQLYSLLRPIVKCWVYSSGIPFWRGQEDDVVEDILQEAIIHILKYYQRAERGEVAPIESLERLSIVVARNCYIDMKRRDCRLMRIPPDGHSSQELVVLHNVVDPAEVAVENVFRERLFVRISHEVVKFPRKQQLVLLIDLAGRMNFSSQTPLQKAFLDAGINLQAYQLPIPRDSKVRKRNASLLNHAYHRLLKLEPVQKYIADL